MKKKKSIATIELERKKDNLLISRVTLYVIYMSVQLAPVLCTESDHWQPYRNFQRGFPHKEIKV